MIMRFCGVCGATVPSGSDLCARCGADAKSFETVMVRIEGGDGVFRVHEVPFHGTREWAKTHFRVLKAPDGNPAYRYMLRDAPMFEIAESTSGFVMTSSIDPAEDANHWRVNGVPVGEPGIEIEKSGQTLELWSGRRHEVVMSLALSLESFT